MNEIVKYVTDLGIFAVMIIIILWLSFKYLPKLIEMKLSRAKEKDYMMDSFKSVVENNTRVIANNSEVIKLNSVTIKNFTDNAHKLEGNIEELKNTIQEQNQTIQELNTNIKILKERK